MRKKSYKLRNELLQLTLFKRKDYTYHKKNTIESLFGGQIFHYEGEENGKAQTTKRRKQNTGT